MAITPLTTTSNSTGYTKPLDERSSVSQSDHNPALLKTQTATKTDSATVTLSTRSERLAALNKEFTITGPGFEVNAAFINRLQELQFLSAGEAQQLRAQFADTDKVAHKDAGPQAIIDLQQDLQALAKKLPAEGLMAQLLEETSVALAELKSSTSLANAPQYKSLQQRLEKALASDSDIAKLNQTERYRMTQAMDVMLIASRLAPGSETNAGIRSYLANT